MTQPFQVFISHYSGEAKIAEELQNFLKDAFPEVHVFRSSDAYSIQTAEGQYAAILQALKQTDVMLVLLSSESAHRPWMPFETGFAMGKKAMTFTLLVRGATLNDVPSPFKEMQLRAIDPIEVEKILSTVENGSGATREPVAVNALLRAIRTAEEALPNVVLELRPYMMKSPPGCVGFHLRYQGHDQITLRSITVAFPYETKDPSWSPREVHGQFEVERKNDGGSEHLFLRYFVGAPPASSLPMHHPLKVLQPHLYPGDEKDLYELRFALNPNIDVFRDDLLIRYWIETEKGRLPEETIPMSDIPR